jgi:hypothetical protein
MNIRKVAAAGFLAVLAALMLTCGAELSHGATTQPRPNSLGLSQSYRSPMAYMVGSIQHIDSFSEATNVVFKPFGSSMLNTETILFCGNIERDLEGGTNQTLFVFTYRANASRMYHGVACHEVYRIMQVADAQ